MASTLRAFCRYDLRTTDSDAARRFYADAIGLSFDAPTAPDEPQTLAVWPLHEQARARGAPAHWLGSIAVTDVEATARRLLDLGSEALGPVLRASDGTAYAVRRDPIGAVVAVREAARMSAHPPVVYHQLHARDVDKAWAVYSELFGWSHTETVDMPDLEGGHRMFAWRRGGKNVGSMANTARWPGVHCHWLYHFPVADLDQAVAEVRAHGGTAMSPAVLPNLGRITACEDPQGAAFGLVQTDRVGVP